MSAEVLRRAAKNMRIDSGINYSRGHMSIRDVRFNRAVADWLDRGADSVEFAIHDQLDDALPIARAYLGESE